MTTLPTSPKSRPQTGSSPFRHTIEFEPTAAGTIIEYRFAAPDDPEHDEMGAEVAHHYEEALRSAIPALVEQLDAQAV